MRLPLLAFHYLTLLVADPPRAELAGSQLSTSDTFNQPTLCRVNAEGSSHALNLPYPLTQ
jgi:hypothetical protein